MHAADVPYLHGAVASKLNDTENCPGWSGMGDTLTLLFFRFTCMGYGEHGDGHGSKHAWDQHAFLAASCMASPYVPLPLRLLTWLRIVVVAWNSWGGTIGGGEGCWDCCCRS